MNRTLSILTLTLVLAVAAEASVHFTEPWSEEFTIAPGGTVVIDNSVGNVEVVVGSGRKIRVSADRVIRAADNSASAEAREQVKRLVEGDERTRVFRGITPRTARWTSAINYSVTVPRDVNIRIGSVLAERIHVNGVDGIVRINNLRGIVVVENVGGETLVDSANGDILYVSNGPLPANTRLISINGGIEVRIAAQSNFTWESEAVAGEALTSFGVHGVRALGPRRIRGSVNVPTKILLVTETFRGNILVQPMGADPRSIRRLAEFIAATPTPTPRAQTSPVIQADFTSPQVTGFFARRVSMGDIAIGEVRGDASIFTGAGEVRLDSVLGRCEVVSNGGPLTLGEITGLLNARTAAGNIVVQSARQGGTIHSGGGTVRVNQSNGPLRMISAGGDVVAREAGGPVVAETKSGDIQITLTTDTKTQDVFAKTLKGNVTLTVPAGFGADVDAVVLTSNPDANFIRTELAGLAIQRDSFDGKTRIRATGKLNGGGQRVELFAQDGGIQINTSTGRVSPAVP